MGSGDTDDLLSETLQLSSRGLWTLLSPRALLKVKGKHLHPYEWLAWEAESKARTCVRAVYVGGFPREQKWRTRAMRRGRSENRYEMSYEHHCCGQGELDATRSSIGNCPLRDQELGSEGNTCSDLWLLLGWGSLLGALTPLCFWAVFPPLPVEPGQVVSSGIGEVVGRKPKDVWWALEMSAWGESKLTYSHLLQLQLKWEVC